MPEQVKNSIYRHFLLDQEDRASDLFEGIHRTLKEEQHAGLAHTLKRSLMSPHAAIRQRPPQGALSSRTGEASPPTP